METELDLWNRALSAIQSRARLTSPTENTPEREECERWWDSARTTALRAVWWPEARAFARLLPVSLLPDPTTMFSYSFYLPPDYLQGRHLETFLRYELYRSSTHKRVLLRAQSPDNLLYYTADNKDVHTWSPQLRDAVALGLAGMIARPLTGKGNLKADLFNEANLILAQNGAQVANEAAHADSREGDYSSWHLARMGTSETLRYFQPVGPIYA